MNDVTEKLAEALRELLDAHKGVNECDYENQRAADEREENARNAARKALAAYESRAQPASEKDMRYLAASDAACILYPGIDQGELRDAYCQGASDAQPARVPDGWVMVPKSATEEMLSKGWTSDGALLSCNTGTIWDAMLKAAPQPPKHAGAADEWKPIETAPTSGPDILVYLDDELMGPIYRVVYCSVGGEWVDALGDSYKATHWMPLPQPPAKENEDAV